MPARADRQQRAVQYARENPSARISDIADRHGVKEKTVRRWLKAAGIERPASPHSLRHSFARDLYRRCRDVLLVKEALRHRSIVSTLVYAQVDEERLRRAIGAP